MKSYGPQIILNWIVLAALGYFVPSAPYPMPFIYLAIASPILQATRKGVPRLPIEKMRSQNPKYWTFFIFPYYCLLAVLSVVVIIQGKFAHAILDSSGGLVFSLGILTLPFIPLLLSHDIDLILGKQTNDM